MKLRCIADTRSDFCETIAGVHQTRSSSQHSASIDSYYNAFQRVELTADSSTIVSHTEDQCLRTFVLPVDLLDDKHEPHHLKAYSTISSPTRIQSYCVYPGFYQGAPNTNFILYASSDVPITLRHAYDSSFVGAKYKLVSPTTEAYLKASSLIFTSDGSRFIAGSCDRLHVFDLSVDGSGPILTQSLRGRARSSTAELQRACAPSGIVSSLSSNVDGLVAAGTLNRDIVLYSNNGSGDYVSSWNVSDPTTPSRKDGNGITKLGWSPDGRYLCTAERQSDIINVYDIRNTGQRVAWLSGRMARTTQRLEFDITPTSSGYELWAGGTDGAIRMWLNPGSRAGEHVPDDTVKLYDDAVTSSIWESSGLFMATCSGSRKINVPTQHHESSSEPESSSSIAPAQVPDNVLRIWAT